MLASEGFVDAHGFQPGDKVPAVINGRRRRLTIVGVALSPEYIYSIRPGELVPDDRRFGVLWMDQRRWRPRSTWRAASTTSSLTMAPGAPPDEAIARLDRILEPYGGLGAIPRALQLSHWTVENELAQLQSFGFLLPLIFLMVAAFILNVALTRALALQRAQIAALKALGYGNTALGWHYMKWALLIGAAGVVLRHRGGAWLGSAIGDLYNQFFRFPVLLFSVPLQRHRRRHGADARRRRCGGVLGGAPRGARAARRGDAARSAGALPAGAHSKRRWSPAASARPGGWCCATSRGSRSAPPSRCSASASPSRC